MVLIHTTIKELDESLKSAIPDSRIAYYPEYLLEESRADTVILSCKTQTKIPLKDFLFALRQQDKRIIFILDDRDSPILGYVLALGIYDIIFTEVTPKIVVEILENPAKFSSVAPLFLGLKGGVSFNRVFDKNEPQYELIEESGQKLLESPASTDGDMPAVKAAVPDNFKGYAGDDVDAAKNQIAGLLKLLGVKQEFRSINEMLLALEQAVVDFVA